MKRFSLILFTLIFTTSVAIAEEEPLRLGFIGSLTSYAGNYGTAVLEGAELAIKELEKEGRAVELVVEDDQSVTKEVVNAFIKLTNVDDVKGIVGGSWWMNSIIKQAEKAHIPILSCEMVYDKDTVPSTNSFILHGDLRDWISVYEPVVESLPQKRAAIIRFASGFGETLETSMRQLFSKSGRTFAGSVEYDDIQVSDAATLLLKLKKLNPEIVYIDGQPASLANLLKSMIDNGMNDLVIFTHSIAEQAIKDKLFDQTKFKNLYFTRRTTFDADFVKRFKDEYHKEPALNSDLGYYAVKLLEHSLKTPDAAKTLTAGVTVQNKLFKFNEHNVFSGALQEVWKVEGDSEIKFESLKE